MAETTGPILAVGGITVLNQTVLHGKPMDWRLPIATGVACGLFALMEHAAPEPARMAAYAALITVLFTRINGVPSPTESFLTWWNQGPGK